MLSKKKLNLQYLLFVLLIVVVLLMHLGGGGPRSTFVHSFQRIIVSSSTRRSSTSRFAIPSSSSSHNNNKFLSTMVAAAASSSLSSSSSTSPTVRTVAAHNHIASSPSEPIITTTTKTSSPATTMSSTKTAPNQAHQARIITSNDDPNWLMKCGERLRQGKLVAFPTETVYGLGCHALDEKAIQKVFMAKERPLSDPLIVHVLNPSQAFELWNATSSSSNNSNNTIESQILNALCAKFWPGPLTLVAVANTNKVPDCVMANTGYVACRSPRHPTARSLIASANVPLAAPSANKFGHVSPTTYRHVYDDLYQEDVWIINDNDTTNNDNNDNKTESNSSSNDTRSNVCEVGVESTVAKLEMNDDKTKAKLIVLRQGAVSEKDLRDCLEEEEDNHQFLLSQVVDVQTMSNRATQDHVPNVAPGQTIRHYSPHIPSYLVSERCYNNRDDSSTTTTTDSSEKQQQQQQQQQHDKDLLVILNDAVVIDYGQQLIGWKSTAKAYRDLSSNQNPVEAARCIFDTLRWAEQVEGARLVLFPQQTTRSNDINSNNNDDDDDSENNGLALAIQDRLTRAASGVVINSLKETSL